MADDKPIIVVKKKGGHGGHHGGAWKVAYADFVTAMMAFFMVMWLVNTAESPTKENIASYFRRPGFFEKGSGSPLEVGGSGILQEGFAPAPEKADDPRAEMIKLKKRKLHLDTYGEGQTKEGGPGGEGKGVDEGLGTKTGGPNRTSSLVPEGDLPFPADLEAVQGVEAELQGEIQGHPEFSDLLGVVDVRVDADGLNIEIMDTEKTSMFLSGSSMILPEAKEAFGILAGIIKKVPNEIDIVGHTDSKPYSSGARGYSNWELSVDRANSARKLLEASGIAPERIRSVIGKADNELKKPENPFDPSNRRITMKIKFLSTDTINLSEGPEKLEKLLTEPNLKEPVSKTEDSEPVHSLSPIDIIHRSREKRNVTIPEPGRDAESGKKVFNESPVLGKFDIFSQ